MKRRTKNNGIGINNISACIKKETSGITLVALVITIIVLLILAGIAVVSLTGENGIIKKAQEAKDKTEQGSEAEQEALNNLVENMNQLEGGNTNPPEDPFMKENTNYTDTNGATATIPKGFKVIEEAKVIKDGLVIEDDKGNQFVWVPVPDMSKFKRTEGYSKGSLQSELSSCGEANAKGVNAKVTESATTRAEAIAMYASVAKYKGFYIGRYEAGKETVASVDTVVSKKNATVWNNIPWSKSNTMNIDTGGAVEKARNMYTDKNKYGVTSTLCYGVQWDASLNFMDPNYITNEVGGKPNCVANSYLVNSTGKGNYLGSLAITGSNEAYSVNNIYDMAGNADEWIMESCYTDIRIFRGGYYNHTASDYPVSSRIGGVPTFTRAYLGFRSTLYL